MRYYSNLATEMTLASPVSSSTTVLSLSGVGGLPSSYPFTLVVDAGQSNEEVVAVQSVTGTNATVTRGADNTTATSHEAGAKVRHMATAQDYSEPQVHMVAESGVHGVSGDVVGTSDAQVLTNKTIVGTSNAISAIQKASLPTDTVYSAATQTLTGKTLDGVTNTFTNIPKGSLPSAVVYTTDTQTLTSKTISSASNTISLDASTITSGTVAKAQLPSDTMYLTSSNPSSFLTLASGWTNTSSHLTVLNGVAFLLVGVIRSGAAIPTNSATGLVLDVLVCTVDPAYAPPRQQPVGCRYGGTTGGWAQLNGSGDVFFIHGAPGVSLDTGDTLIMSFVYPL